MRYNNARGIDIAPAPRFDRQTPLYTMPTTGERKKGKKRGEEDITKEIDAKQAFTVFCLNYQSMKEMGMDHYIPSVTPP